MAEGGGPVNFVRHLDHPLLFLIFLTLGVTATQALLTWGFKKAGMPGPAALTQLG